MNELEDNLNDYINGSISFLTYRQKRTAYINNFVNSGYLPDDTIPLNSIDQQQVKDAVQQQMKNARSLKSDELLINRNSQKSTKKQYVILALLIIIAGLSWFYSTQVSTQLPLQPSSKQSKSMDQHNKPISAPELSSTNKIASTVKSTTQHIEKKFIMNFLAVDKWNSDSLSSFLVKWQALSRLEKKKTKKSQSFLRLKNSLRLRILEQQALQNGKNKAAVRQENLLVWFASQLSINVN